jgi:hypothetical protein
MRIAERTIAICKIAAILPVQIFSTYAYLVHASVRLTARFSTSARLICGPELNSDQFGNSFTEPLTINCTLDNIALPVKGTGAAAFARQRKLPVVFDNLM